MALVLADRVQETATANTTVSFTMLGAVAGYQSFATVGNTNTTYYAATDTSGNWEVGLGTYSTTGPTLTRTTILSSSASGSAVTFSGTVTVFLTYPSERSVYLTSATAANPSNQGGISFGTLNYYDTYVLQSLQGSNNGYVYSNIQNTSSGGIASADFAIYNDQAGTRYINVGVNSSGYGTSTGLLTTGGASSTTATVTVYTGNLLNYSVITGTGIPAGAYIVTQLTSTAVAKATATQTSGGITGSSFFQISSLAGIQIGYLISGTGIPNGTYVGSFNGASNGINLVNAAGSSVTTTANATGTYNFYEPGSTGTYQTSVAITSSGTGITAQVPGSYNQPNNGYIYSYGGDMVIGTLTANAFHVVTNNSNTDSITVSSSGGVTFPSGVSFSTALTTTYPNSGLLNQGPFSYGTLNYYDNYLLQSLQSSNDGYISSVIQNTNNGAGAISRFNAVNDTGYNVYLGINSSNYGAFVGTGGTGGVASTTLTITAVTSGRLISPSGFGTTQNYTNTISQLTATGTPVVTASTFGGTSGTSVITFSPSAITNVQVGYLISGVGISSGVAVYAVNPSTGSVTLCYIGSTLLFNLTTSASGVYSFYVPGGVGQYGLAYSTTITNGSTITTRAQGPGNFPSNASLIANADLTIGTRSGGALHFFAGGANTYSGAANSGDALTVSAFNMLNIPNATESVYIQAATINSNLNILANNGPIQMYTVAATANWTQNISTSGTYFSAYLAVGQAYTIAILVYQGSTAYYMNGTLQIDGTATGVTTYWQGGSVPTKGNANGYDVYTYTIIKTATTPTYTVLCSLTQF